MQIRNPALPVQCSPDKYHACLVIVLFCVNILVRIRLGILTWQQWKHKVWSDLFVETTPMITRIPLMFKVTHLSRSPSSWSSQCETQDWDSGVSQAPRLAKLEMSMMMTAMVMMILKIIIIIIVRSDTLVYAECWKSQCQPWSGFLQYFFWGELLTL